MYYDSSPKVVVLVVIVTGVYLSRRFGWGFDSDKIIHLGTRKSSQLPKQNENKEKPLAGHKLYRS